jgi:hypothetical protein
MTFIILSNSILLALTGILLGRRYSAFALIPASFFVVVAIAVVGAALGVGLWTTGLWVLLGVSSLHIGHLLGLAALAPRPLPQNASSDEFESVRYFDLLKSLESETPRRQLRGARTHELETNAPQDS